MLKFCNYSECCYWADVEATTLSAIYEDELVMNYHNKLVLLFSW